jgi:hypothetical protein
MNTDITAAENYRVVVHELGHFFICLHYKIASHIEIFSIDGGEHFDTNGDRSAGACFSEKFGTPFQDSVCSWAGLMAELIAGVQPPQFDTGFPMELKNLKYCHAIILSKYFKDLSLSDQLGICGKNSNDTLRSFKAAFRILSAEKSELLRLAELRTSRAAGRIAKPSMPLPEKFPATHADFLRLICADEANFGRFIASRIALHLTNGRTSNLEDVKSALGTSFADAYAMSLNLQRSIYAGDFKTETDWLAAARAFKAWTETASVKNPTEQTL